MIDPCEVRFEASAIEPGTLQVYELTGRERISELFAFEIHAVSTDPGGVDDDALVASEAQIVFTRGGEVVRRIGGIVSTVRDALFTEARHTGYSITFVPRAYRLTLTSTSEIFMGVSAQEILQKKLERAGLALGDDFEFRLSGAYPVHEFMVQYKETDLAFCSRLAEHFGISFFFEHREGRDVVVFSDANTGFKPIEGSGHADFRPRGDAHGGVHRLERTTRMLTKDFVVKDYNYRTPKVPLLAQAQVGGAGGGAIVEYGAHFKTLDEGKALATVRAEEAAATRRVFDGDSDVEAFAAGASVKIEGHGRGDVELLLVEVRHTAKQVTALGGTGGERSYTNAFQAIPYDVPFRPARVTPKPRVNGVVTGVVDAAESGPYAEIDGDGRYRVRFLYDTADPKAGQGSRPVRMAQPHGGAGFGMHFPLRSGVEVILTCVEGDPDRPIITGVVPNPETPSPVTGGNGKRNIIRTGGGNEINIDDNDGTHRIKMTTPHGNTVFQLGAQNEAEEGGVFSSEKNFSTVSGGAQSALSKSNTVISDVVKAISAGDIVQYAGVAKGLLNFESVTKILSDGADAVKAFADLPGKWYEGQKAALQKQQDDAGKQAAQLREEIQDLERSRADAKLGLKNAGDPGAAMQPMADLFGVDLDATVQMAIEAKQKELALAVEQAAAAKKQIDDIDAGSVVSASDAVSKGADAVKSAVDTIAAGKELWSTVSDLFGEASKAAAVLEAEGFSTGAATAAAAPTPGKVKAAILPIVTPYNVNAAVVSSAVIGTVNAIVAGGEGASVFSPFSASLVGGKGAVVHSPLASELYGGTGAYVTSLGRVDIQATGLLMMRAGASAALSTDDKLVVKAKAKAKFTFQDDWEVGVEKKSTLTSKDELKVTGEKSILLELPNAASKLKMDADLIDLRRGEWGMASTDGKVTLGDHTSQVKLEGGAATLTDGSAKLELKKTATLTGSTVEISGSSGVSVNSARIDLG